MDYGKTAYEDRHKLRQHGFEILKKFDFKYSPIGFKFLNAETDLKGLGLKPLGERIAWCQMLPEAPEREGFLREGGRPVLRARHLSERL